MPAVGVKVGVASMAREQNKLSARFVQTVGKPGRHSDGGGLYLVVDVTGAKRWLFMFRCGGKLKELGLGGLSAVSLAQARDKADAVPTSGEGRNKPHRSQACRKGSGERGEDIWRNGRFAHC